MQTTDNGQARKSELTDGDFPPGYIERANNLIQGSAKAAADPMPGPLLDAFLPEPLKVIGLELRPLVATDIAILKRIKSPLIDLFSQAAIDPELPRPVVTFEEEDLWEIVYLWTRPLPLSRAVLATGRQNFRETALAETGDKLPINVVADHGAIVGALERHFVNAFATRISHAATRDENFPMPPAQPVTGSAGGLSTSPGSSSAAA